jgi:pimeloyl-ACP methyl ester carboxylesterase
LLHGFPEFWYGWRRQIGPLAAAGRYVIVPDQRGYNLSSKPPGVEHYRLELLAGDVVALMDGLGLESAVIAGHDWGAAVAWWLGLRWPERVRRLVILNVPHPLALRKTLWGSPRQWEYRQAWARPRALTTMLHWYRAALRYPVRVRGPGTVQVPTDIIWGEEDAFLVPELAPASLAFCREGTLTSLPGCSHWVQHEAPERVTGILLG